MVIIYYSIFMHDSGVVVAVRAVWPRPFGRKGPDLDGPVGKKGGMTTGGARVRGVRGGVGS